MEIESTIPDGGFEKEQQLKDWLNCLPEKQTNVFARTISLRAAQRALVNIIEPFASKSDKAKWRVDLTVSTLRCNIISRVAAACSTLEIGGNLRKAAHSALLDASSAEGLVVKAFSAAGSAARSAAGVPAFFAAHAAAHSALSGSLAALSADSSAITADARALEAGATPEETAVRPLWPEESPYKPQFNRKTFLAAAPSFEVWLDWYEPIVDGKAPWGLPRDIANKLEERIALGDYSDHGGHAFWERDADEVNAEIKGWVEAAQADAAATAQDSDSIEIAQDPTAAIMVATEQGQIDRAPIPISQRLLDTPEQRKEYANCRDDVLQLIDYGPNQLGRLLPQLAAMLDAMPIAFAEANTIDFWRTMNRLRRTYNSHLNAADPLPGDNAYLNPDVAEDLGSIVDLLNVFASFDPALRDRDYRRIAPQDRPAIFEERLLGMAIVEAVLATEEILTPNAQTEIKNNIESASDAIATEHGSQALDQQNRTTRNVFGALMDVARNAVMKVRAGGKKEVGFAWTEFRSGAYKAAGAGTISLIGSEIIGLTQFHVIALKFISENWTALSTYASQVIGNPKIVELIEFIAKLMN